MRRAAVAQAYQRFQALASPYRPPTPLPLAFILTPFKIVTYQSHSFGRAATGAHAVCHSSSKKLVGNGLEPQRMPSWKKKKKKRKSKLNEIMHAKRMFNQRAKRKLEITWRGGENRLMLCNYGQPARRRGALACARVLCFSEVVSLVITHQAVICK